MSNTGDFPNTKYALLKIFIACCIRFGKSWKFYILYNFQNGSTKELHLSLIRYFQGATKALRKWRIEMMGNIAESKIRDTIKK